MYLGADGGCPLDFAYRICTCLRRIGSERMGGKDLICIDTLYSERGKREFIDAMGLVKLYTSGFEAGVSMGLRATRG